MKISILTPDLSHNCIGRAYLLAKILQRHYEVEIAGPIFGDKIWEPVVGDRSITYKSVKICGRFRPYGQLKKLFKEISGDVIYAHKPLFTSFGIGLLKKLAYRKPLILDIDDWQMGFMKESYSGVFQHYFGFLVSSAVRLYSMGSYWNTLIGEKLVGFADAVTVSNNFLKEMFGGTIVWHGRDTGVFDPVKFDKNLLRDEHKIEKVKKVIMFFGTPRLNKGVEDLIKAVSLIENQDIVLVIVGINDRDEYCRSLVNTAEEVLGNRFKGFGLQPFEKVPEFLAMADIVVIPQRKNFATVGQVPAKVFDAMAMARPIIATSVSDLPEILDGCGWIVEPERPERLAVVIQYIFVHPEEAEERRWKAREKCIKKYSWNAMEKVLVDVFSNYDTAVF